jgi:hypothetical protein
MIQVSPDWLALREAADGAARAPELVDLVAGRLRQFDGHTVVRDLGCGTGSMARWLADRLPGPWRWLMQDHDVGLLDSVDVPGTVIPLPGDVTALSAADLAATSLVTASALLDLLTEAEVDGLVAACVAAGCPALFALSVTGKVELTPDDPLDADVEAAFNAHQRRVVGDRKLLGPDAADATTAAFARRGVTVIGRPSPWRLDGAQADLTEEWLIGWVDAAREQSPGLDLADYLDRRLAQADAGDLRVVVHHTDVLALPGERP